MTGVIWVSSILFHALSHCYFLGGGRGYSSINFIPCVDLSPVPMIRIQSCSITPHKHSIVLSFQSHSLPICNLVATIDLFSITMILPLGSFILIYYVTVWDWLFSLRVMLLKAIRVVWMCVSIVCPSLVLCSISWCEYSTVRLSIHLVQDFGAVSSFRFGTFRYKCLCKYRLPFSGVNTQEWLCSIIS